MRPHVTDHPRQPTPSRLAHYLSLARQEYPHPATRTLAARQAEPPAERRMQEYLRIARGRTV